MACSGAYCGPHRMLAGGPDVRMSARHGRQSGMSDGCALRDHFNRPSPRPQQQPLMGFSSVQRSAELGVVGS